MKAPGRQGEGGSGAGWRDPSLLLLGTQQPNLCNWLGPKEGVPRTEQEPGSEATTHGLSLILSEAPSRSALSRTQAPERHVEVGFDGLAEQFHKHSLLGSSNVPDLFGGVGAAIETRGRRQGTSGGWGAFLHLSSPRGSRLAGQAQKADCQGGGGLGLR